MDGTDPTVLVNTFRTQLVAALKGMPDVQEALAALPDAAARARYLRAVLARVAQQSDPLLAAALTLALSQTPAETLAPELSPRAGILVRRHFNDKRRPEQIERNGAAFVVPAAVANLLREALAHDEIDADRRIVEQMVRLLPELADLLVMDQARKGSAKLRAIYNVAPEVRKRIALL